MNVKRDFNQYGGVAFNVVLVLLIVVIGLMVYVLVSGGDARTNRNAEFLTGAVDTNMSDSRAPTMRTTNDTAVSDPRDFDDGLGRADATRTYELDEVGAGLARIDAFSRDINNDGRPDRITRRLVENGTAHFTYKYKIELNTPDVWVDITPDDFYTIEGAECSLQKLHFVFSPAFGVIKISRPWQDSWDTPTAAVRDIYAIRGDNIVRVNSRDVGVVCDVAERF